MLRTKVSSLLFPGRENVIEFTPQLVEINNLDGWIPVSDMTTNYGVLQYMIMPMTNNWASSVR